MAVCSLSTNTVLGNSAVSHRVTIARGLIFKNEAILAITSQRTIANLKDEPGRRLLQERRIRFAQVLQEGLLYVVGLADIDPLARIRDSVKTRLIGCVLPDSR